MMLLDAIQKTSLILPEHKEEFLKYLKKFPDGIQKWLYAENITDADSLYQGDILINIPTCFIDNDGDTIVGEDFVSLISNTCDMQRDRNDFIIVSPIVFFEEYKESFIHTKIGIENTLNDIRKNRIFSYFYLPPKNNFSESFIDFSRMIAISSPYLNKIKAFIYSTVLHDKEHPLTPNGIILTELHMPFWEIISELLGEQLEDMDDFQAIKATSKMFASLSEEVKSQDPSIAIFEEQQKHNTMTN